MADADLSTWKTKIENLLDGPHSVSHQEGKEMLEKGLKFFKGPDRIEMIRWALNLSGNFSARATKAREAEDLRENDNERGLRDRARDILVRVAIGAGEGDQRFLPLDDDLTKVNLNGGIVLFRDPVAQELYAYNYNGGDGTLEPVDDLWINWKGPSLGKFLGIGRERHEPRSDTLEAVRQLHAAARDVGNRRKVPPDIRAALDTARKTLPRAVFAQAKVA